jgi:hypothetical protein
MIPSIINAIKIKPKDRQFRQFVMLKVITVKKPMNGMIHGIVLERTIARKLLIKIILKEIALTTLRLTQIRIQEADQHLDPLIHQKVLIAIVLVQIHIQADPIHAHQLVTQPKRIKTRNRLKDNET